MSKSRVSSPTSKIEPRAPLPVRIISWLMLFFGLSCLVGALLGTLIWDLLPFPSFALALLMRVLTSTLLPTATLSEGENLLWAITRNANINYIRIGIPILLGIGFIAVGYGLGRMRKWALYALTALIFIKGINWVYSYAFFSNQDAGGILLFVIWAMTLIYLWSISKKFT